MTRVSRYRNTLWVDSTRHWPQATSDAVKPVENLKSLENLDVVVGLQHPPTYTVGRRGLHKIDKQEQDRLTSLGAAYRETLRGGEITFHGPGQLVIYPILNLRRHDVKLRDYIHILEEATIRTCNEYGIQAGRTSDTGVWVDHQNKIAAIGVHARRFVTSHGIALNCNTDLSWFNQITPCGIPDKGVTSLQAELDKQRQPAARPNAQASNASPDFYDMKIPSVTVSAVFPVWLRNFGQLLGVNTAPLLQTDPGVAQKIRNIQKL